MKKLSLLLLLASPALAAEQAPLTVVQTASLPAGYLDSSKIKLDAQDAPGALADAEIALAKGGGAAAYAARGDAKRALGGRVDEAIADYGEAAKLDPRYVEKYKGLIAQKASELRPITTGRAGKGLNGVPISEIATVAVVGIMLLVAGGRLLSRRGEHAVAPDDDDATPPQAARGPDRRKAKVG